MTRPKIVLAFSGGLDTSFCVPYLMEQGFDVVTCFVDTGGVSAEERAYIEDRAKKLGAIEHVTEDGGQSVWDNVVVQVTLYEPLCERLRVRLCAQLGDDVAVQVALMECLADERALGKHHDESDGAPAVRESDADGDAVDLLERLVDAVLQQLRDADAGRDAGGHTKRNKNALTRR